MKNLNNFKQALKSSKRWKSMGYICLKTTFPQQKYIQKIIHIHYFQLLVWKFIKFLMSFLTPSVIFYDTTRLYYFSSNVTYFWQKYPIKVKIFRFFTAQVKIHQVSHVIFQTKSDFFSWNCTWLGQKETIKVQNFRLLTAQIKFHQICTLIGSSKYIKF